MKITEIAGAAVLSSEIPRPTDEQLQREYNYILAEQMARNMLQASLITDDEYARIMEKCCEMFSPVFSNVGPKLLDSFGA